MDDDKSNNYIPGGSWIETAATCENIDIDDATPHKLTFGCQFSEKCEKCQKTMVKRTETQETTKKL